MREGTEYEGEILSTGKNHFRVRLLNGDAEHVVVARLSGRLRTAHFRCVPGDRVRLEVSPYDLNRGRIVYRLV